jgi:hypothetical protein
MLGHIGADVYNDVAHIIFGAALMFAALGVLAALPRLPRTWRRWGR